MTMPKSDSEKFYLNCPYHEKDECKSLGGWWDVSAKKWFVPSDLDPDEFKKWWPETTGSYEDVPF
jgi:hypothetical protein